MEAKEKNLAVLIDFENIAAGTEKEGLGKFDIDAVLARLKDKGRILIARSYADWGRFARFKQSLLAANVTMFELTSHGMQDKNRADIATVVDCLELAYTRDYIDTYVIVSGDSDFTPLVLKLKELNKQVIGVGTRNSTSRLIINACDEFIFYESIVQKTKSRRVGGSVPKDRAKAFELVNAALEGMLREDPNPPHASELKSVVLRRQPDFSESDLGFPSFGRFLESAQDAGVVTLTRDQKSGGYRVELAEEDAAPADAPSGRAEQAPRAARPEGVYDDAYFPAGSEKIVAKLHSLGLTPLSASTRMALLEALVESTQDRSGKKRRVNVGMAIEDIRKRLRRTHGELSANQMRAFIDTLIAAGQLLHHREGTPIRNGNAMFSLDKSAEKLNRVLADVYLRKLRASGADLSDVRMVAELLFGDRERHREVEEILAWMAAPEAGEDAITEEHEVELGAADDDLDALLLSDDAPAGAPAADADGDADPKKRRRRKKRGGGGGSRGDADLDALLDVEDEPTTSSSSDLDDLLVVDDEPAPPKAKPAPKAKPTVADLDALLLLDDEPAPPAAAPASDVTGEVSLDDVLVVDDEPDSAPPPKIRKSTRSTAKAAPAPAPVPVPVAAPKAEAPEAEAPEAEAADAKPKRKRTSTPKKKKADEAPAAGGDDLDGLLVLDED